jgi:hypothetical protein
LKLSVDANKARVQPSEELLHNRLIPSAVKLEVWTRDKASASYAAARRISISITICRFPRAVRP